MRWNQWSLILLFLGFVKADEIPAKFLGEWQLQRTENMDEYMIARGET
jgi:hypothetical protein